MTPARPPLTWLALLALLLALAGCRAAPAAAPAVDWRPIGASVEGRPILAASFGDEGERVLLLAGIHGSEPAGGPLLRRCAELLAERPDWARGRRVVVVPELNPDGLAAGTRANARGVDLNRNFPAANFDASSRRGPEPLSEPESRALHDLILAEKPARVLSLHQPLDGIDYDGPAEALARALEAAGPLRVRKLGARPGSLGSWVGLDLAVPILTIELPAGAEARGADQLWATYGALLVAAVRGVEPPASL